MPHISGRNGRKYPDGCCDDPNGKQDYNVGVLLGALPVPVSLFHGLLLHGPSLIQSLASPVSRVNGAPGRGLQIL